jgi:hypothetical protein
MVYPGQFFRGSKNKFRNNKAAYLYRVNSAANACFLMVPVVQK